MGNERIKETKRELCYIFCKLGHYANKFWHQKARTGDGRDEIREDEELLPKIIKFTLTFKSIVGLIKKLVQMTYRIDWNKSGESRQYRT